MFLAIIILLILLFVFSPSSKPRETEDPFDSRLLCGLVQDVWDKFNSLKFSLLARQRHEAESLWLAQREQWVNRKRELGINFLSRGQTVVMLDVGGAILVCVGHTSIVLYMQIISWGVNAPLPWINPGYD